MKIEKSSIDNMKFLNALFIFFITLSCSCGEKHMPEGTMVTISLPKKTYKMYEPIMLEYEWINYKDMPDSIWGIFSGVEFIKQVITDDKGNLYTQQLSNRAFVLYPLNSVVYKNDTLHKIVYLNLYGKKFGDRRDSAVFYSDSYFPPGRYTVYSVIDNDVSNILYDKPIITNKVEFEVDELNEQENEIIRHARSKDFKAPLNAYTNNYFEEHLLYSVISENVVKFLNAGEDNDRYKDTSKLGEKYRYFFDKYPSSLYNLQNMFIIHYLRAVSRDSLGAYTEMNKLVNTYPNSMISIAVNQIIKMDKLFGKTQIWLRNYHYNQKGKSEPVNPAR